MGSSTRSTRRSPAGRSEALCFDDVRSSSAAGRSFRRQLRHRGGRVRRHARRERRRQDDAHARRARPRSRRRGRDRRARPAGHPRPRAVGYMPQNRGAIAGLSLPAGTSSPAPRSAAVRLGPLDKATRREIDWALDEVGARDLARRSIGELSGGERQRVLLSQALIGRPAPAPARRAADLARSGASEERGRNRQSPRSTHFECDAARIRG